MTRRALIECLFVMCSAIFYAAPVMAHKGSDAYLEVQQLQSSSPTYRFNFSVALKDLDLILPVDANGDGKVTWREVKAVTPLCQTSCRL
jgi:hypothetical protein